MEYSYFIIFTDAIRFIIGPMNLSYCFIKTIWRSYYATSSLLYFDLIAIVRYVFIFHLKNPSAFRDDFWIVFINAWIMGASLIFNFAWFYKADHQIINYYMCTGTDPTEDFKKPLKLYAAVEIGSLLVHLLVYLRIAVYKFGLAEPTKAVGMSQVKNFFLSKDDKNSIASLATNILNVVGLCLLLGAGAFFSMIPPSEMKNYSRELLFSYLVLTTLSFSIFLIAFYTNHRPLRKAALKAFGSSISRGEEILLRWTNRWHSKGSLDSP